MVALLDFLASAKVLGVLCFVMLGIGRFFSNTTIKEVIDEVIDIAKIIRAGQFNNLNAKQKGTLIWEGGLSLLGSCFLIISIFHDYVSPYIWPLNPVLQAQIAASDRCIEDRVVNYSCAFEECRGKIEPQYTDDLRRLENKISGYLGSETCVEAVRSQKDETVWQKAEQSDTIAGYDGYLKGPPPLKHEAEARQRRDRLEAEAADETAWKAVRQSDTIAGYDAYLKGPPPLKHEAEARQRRDQLEAEAADETVWQRAQQLGTIAGYDAYLKGPPPLKHEAEARQRRDQLEAEVADETAWKAARQSDTIAGYDAYLKGPSPLKHEAEARQRRDRLEAEAADETAWKAAQQSDTIAGYDVYLKGPSPLKHEAEARQRRDQLEAEAADETAWQRAQQLGTIAGYDAYLKGPPPLRHGAEARQRRDQLTSSLYRHRTPLPSPGCQYLVGLDGRAKLDCPLETEKHF